MPRLENYLNASVYTNGGDWGTFLVVTFFAWMGFNILYYKKG